LIGPEWFRDPTIREPGLGSKMKAAVTAFFNMAFTPCHIDTPRPFCKANSVWVVDAASSGVRTVIQ
jgi:hypothetical protein